MIWKGKTVGVNDWTAVRVVVKGRQASKVYGAVRSGLIKLVPIVYKKAKYKAFVSDLSARMREELTRHGKNYVDVEIWYSAWKVRDTDGVIKPVLDALEEAGVVDNDRYVRNIRVCREYHGRDEEDEIRIKATRVSADPVTKQSTLGVDDER